MGLNLYIFTKRHLWTVLKILTSSKLSCGNFSSTLSTISWACSFKMLPWNKNQFSDFCSNCSEIPENLQILCCSEHRKFLCPCNCAFLLGSILNHWKLRKLSVCPYITFLSYYGFNTPPVLVWFLYTNLSNLPI